MKSALTKSLICSIFNAGQILRERARAESSLTDCSFLHMHTLHYLEENGSVNMKEIANFLHITPPSATSLVNSLVTRGFITRVGNESDRRTIKLQITAAGRTLLKNSFKRIVADLEKHVARLSESEQKAFSAILNKIS